MASADILTFAGGVQLKEEQRDETVDRRLLAQHFVDAVEDLIRTREDRNSIFSAPSVSELSSAAGIPLPDTSARIPVNGPFSSDMKS